MSRINNNNRIPQIPVTPPPTTPNSGGEELQNVLNTNIAVPQQDVFETGRPAVIDSPIDRESEQLDSPSTRRRRSRRDRKAPGQTDNVRRGIIDLLTHEGAVNARQMSCLPPIGQAVQMAQHAQALSLGMEGIEDAMELAAHIQTPGGYDIKFSDDGHEFAVFKEDKTYNFRLEREDSGEITLLSDTGLKFSLPGAVILEDGTKLNFGWYINKDGEEPSFHAAIIHGDAFTKVEGGRTRKSSFDTLAKTLSELSDQGAIEEPKQYMRRRKGSHFRELQSQIKQELSEQNMDWVLKKNPLTASDLDRMYREGRVDQEGNIVNRYLEIGQEGLTEYQTIYNQNPDQFVVKKGEESVQYQVKYNEQDQPELYREGQKIEDDLRKIEHGRYQEANSQDALFSKQFFADFLRNFLNNRPVDLTGGEASDEGDSW